MTGEIIANDAQRKLVPGFGGRISAALVWDGQGVTVPEAMGVPRRDQMQGTARERLIELSGRVCYDAMGKGRSSSDYAKHILQVGHTSIMEHAAVTVEIRAEIPGPLAVCLLNRPGVWVRLSGSTLRITLNPRVILDWGKHSQGEKSEAHLAEVLLHLIAPLCPAYLATMFGSNRGIQPSLDYLGIKDHHIVHPEADQEKWVSLYIAFSRGASHELVRHRHQCAVSQRSSRFCEESESEWVMHPLVAQWLQDVGLAHVIPLGEDASSSVGIQIEAIQRSCGVTYRGLVSSLEPWLVAKGVDKTTARKQARGAARGMLGNALETEVIFSASAAQWCHMLSMRAADAADGEIRLGFAEAVLPCLKASRYGDRFADLELVPAGDGIGRSLKGGGHK